MGLVTTHFWYKILFHGLSGCSLCRSGKRQHLHAEKWFCLEEKFVWNREKCLVEGCIDLEWQISTVIMSLHGIVYPIFFDLTYGYSLFVVTYYLNLALLFCGLSKLFTASYNCMQTSQCIKKQIFFTLLYFPKDIGVYLQKVILQYDLHKWYYNMIYKSDST